MTLYSELYTNDPYSELYTNDPYSELYTNDPLQLTVHKWPPTVNCTQMTPYIQLYTNLVKRSAVNVIS